MMQLHLRRIAALTLILGLLTGCAPAKPGPADETTDNPVTTEAPKTPETTPGPGPATTTAPAPETTVPAPETTAPPPETTVPPITASGKFSSETGSNLEIHLEWEVIGQSANSATVRANAYITHYQIWVSARHGGKLIIGKSSQTFSTEGIDYDGKKKQTVPLTTSTVDVPLDADGTATIELSVSWPFIGTYSGIKIDNLTCGGTIHIGREPGSAPTTTAPAETTAPPASTTVDLTAQGQPAQFKTSLFVDRNSAHFSGVTLVRSTVELARLLEAHPADCKNTACTSITAALGTYDAAYFATKALLLVPQGNRWPTAAPVSVFDVRYDDGSLHVHIRDLAPSRTAEEQLSTRFYLQAIELEAALFTNRTVNITQHGVYYTDVGRYERDYLIESGVLTAPVTRAYQAAAITP